MNERSETNLTGVHPQLVELVRRAWDVHRNFIVTEGRRTKERQAQLLQAGATRTMNSKHLTGHAVDLAATVNGEVRWDWSLFLPLADVMKACAAEMQLEVTWGGSWRPLSSMRGPITAGMLSRSFPDGPHFEIDPQKYPMP